VPRIPTWRKGPDTPEYRRLKYIYYALLVSGFVLIMISFVLNFWLAERFPGYNGFYPIAAAYVVVIAAFILDATKIKKIQRSHALGSTDKMSPKQIKHVQQKADAAAQLEESRKAQRELQRAQSKNPFVKARVKKAQSQTELTVEAVDDEAVDAVDEATVSAETDTKQD